MEMDSKIQKNYLNRDLKTLFQWIKTFLDKTNEQTSQVVLYDMKNIVALNNFVDNLKKEEFLESLEDV